MVLSRQLFSLTLYSLLGSIVFGQDERSPEEVAEATSSPAPISGALYLDAWQIEKEFLFTPMALQQWYDLGLQSDSNLSPERRASLKPVIGNFLASRCLVSIRDEPIAFTLDRIHFIQPDASEFSPIDPDDTVLAGETWISVVFAAPHSDPRQALQLVWDLIPETDDFVTVKVADPEGTRIFELNRLNPALNIRGRFRPEERAPPPPAPSVNQGNSQKIPVPLLSIILLLAAILVGFTSYRKKKLGILRISAIALATIAAISARGISGEITLKASTKAISDTDAAEILDPLLRGIYHSFNYTDQEQQYEKLSLVATGEALTPIFLDLQRILRSRERDGSRVRVKDLGISKCIATPVEGRPGFEALCSWQAEGRVGHWGHFHDRSNAYRAVFIVEPLNGTWKITGLDLQDRERKPAHPQPSQQQLE